MDLPPHFDEASQSLSVQGQESQRATQRRAAERVRKRAARACDGCRRQKEKCDGGVPCRRCVRLRKQCEFKRSGARSVAPPCDSTESRPASLGEGLESSERIKHMERLLQHYAGDISLDPGNLRDLAEAVDQNRPVPRRAASVSQGSGSVGADDENFTVQPLGNNITHYSGEFSHWNFSMRIKQWIEHCAKDSPNGLNFKEYYRAEELQSRSNAFASLASLPPRFIANFLVQAFFAHAETNYFYVDKNWLIGKLDIAYDNPSALTRQDVGTICILFIVLAIGTQYAYLDSPSQSAPENDISGTFSEDAIGVSFYQQACQLVPDVITVSSLESVQACLLIGIYTLPLDASGLSYIYLNLAVKLAIQNGMHRRYPAEGLDPGIRETRNRVWWTAYSTEKRVAIFHGRPLAIDSNYVDAELPIDNAEALPSQSSTHIPSMLATLQLHQILSKMSQEISALKNHAESGSLDILTRLVDLDADLHCWWDGLPETICSKDPTIASAVKRSSMHLRLEYCLVRMFTGRPFISLGAPSRSTASTSSSPADAVQSSPSSQRPQRKTGTPQSQSSRKSSFRSILVKDCVDAALDVIEVCKTLRNTIGLARASYTEFSACRAALLVIITQCLQGRTPRLRSALRDGVAMIKLMSTGGESARSEASLIEVFERAIARLDATDIANTSSSESDYTRFKQWEMLWKNESPGAATSRDERDSDAPGPMPPPMSGLWGADANLGRPEPTPMQAVPPSMAPMDWSFASFPQTVDEFSSMFGHGFGPSPDSMGDQGQGPPQPNMWMGS